MNFYSQQGEDYFIYYHYINKVCDGTFVELGALDGVTYSNTKFFEDKLEFKGVLIEPGESYEQLVVNRGKTNRCYRYAVSRTEGVTSYVGQGALAGIPHSMPSAQRRQSGRPYRVNTVPLSKLLVGLDYIDILSIDVEGGEKEVLETMTWSIPVYIVVIELDGRNEIKDDSCRDILRNNGLDYEIRIGGNEFWVNKNYFRKEELFDKNAPAPTHGLRFVCLEPSMAEEAIQRTLRYCRH